MKTVLKYFLAFVAGLLVSIGIAFVTKQLCLDEWLRGYFSGVGYMAVYLLIVLRRNHE